VFEGETQREAMNFVSPGTEVDTECIEYGAASIKSAYDEALCIPEEVEAGLRRKGYRVPVIYPVPVTIKYLETLVDLRLTQSKRTYMQPPDKERNIWERLE
jgi:Asp/Glu/hydantoin racemase